ncbi:MAG: tetratricopeptide repeat protein [Gemmatimonadaceae bacterium]
MTLFSEAAARDPLFARAHAGIAESAVLLPLYSNVSRASVADTIRASASRAMAHDSLLAAPHVALGLLEKGLGRWADSEREFSGALRLDPNDASAHQNLGELYLTLGRFDDARTSLGRAAYLEPMEPVIVAEFAYALMQAGALDSATRVAARAGVAAPRSPFVAYTLGILAERDGNAVLASQHMRTAAAAAPIPFFRGALARSLSLIGDTTGADAIQAELAALKDAPGAAFGRVIAGVERDPPELLFEGLARAVRENDPFVLLLPLRDPWYDRLRNDARFSALAERLRLPISSIAPNARRAGGN